MQSKALQTLGSDRSAASHSVPAAWQRCGCPEHHRCGRTCVLPAVPPRSALLFVLVRVGALPHARQRCPQSLGTPEELHLGQLSCQKPHGRAAGGHSVELSSVEEKPKHALCSFLLGQKARHEPDSPPQGHMSQKVKLKRDMYVLVELRQAEREESCASPPPLRHAGKEN